MRLDPARIYIKKNPRRPGIYGLGEIRRYSVRFGTGMVHEFLIQAYDKTQSREWQALFARCLAQCLNRMADYLEGKKA